MRGKHKHYIDEVNASTNPFYIKVGRNRWRTTEPVIFYLPSGRTMIPSGTTWNMFSFVPNTGYIEFHKASLLHDVQRGRIPRYQADFNFAYDMMHRITVIRGKLLDTDCPREVVDREIIRLARVASLYTIGVSGKIGSLYIWLDKIL